MLAGLWLTIAIAAATEADAPACPAVTAPEEGAVVWVTRANTRVTPWTRLSVVPARELRAALRPGDGVARLLQLTGRRKSAKPPRGAWLVTVFEPPSSALCWPVDADRAGGPTDRARCPKGDRGVQGRHDGCGRLIDRASNQPRLPVLRVTWRDAAARGFCVLPADRWVQGR